MSVWALEPGTMWHHRLKGWGPDSHLSSAPRQATQWCCSLAAAKGRGNVWAQLENALKMGCFGTKNGSKMGQKWVFPKMILDHLGVPKQLK